MMLADEIEAYAILTAFEAACNASDARDEFTRYGIGIATMGLQLLHVGAVNSQTGAGERAAVRLWGEENGPDQWARIDQLLDVLIDLALNGHDTAVGDAVAGNSWLPYVNYKSPVLVSSVQPSAQPAVKDLSAKRSQKRTNQKKAS